MCRALGCHFTHRIMGWILVKSGTHHLIRNQFLEPLEVGERPLMFLFWQMQMPLLNSWTFTWRYGTFNCSSVSIYNRFMEVRPWSSRAPTCYKLTSSKLVNMNSTIAFRLIIKCLEMKLEQPKKQQQKTKHQHGSKSWIQSSRRRWGPGTAEECRRSQPNAVFVAAAQRKWQPLPGESTATALGRESHTCIQGHDHPSHPVT